MSDPAEDVTRFPSCPARYVLGQLAAGSLPEEQANKIFEHIEDCERCQGRIDKVTSHSDGLIQAARRDVSRNAVKKTGHGNLSQLIQKAQALSPTTTTINNEADTAVTGRKRVDINGFVDGLKKSGLLDEAEVLRFMNKVNQDGNSTDSAQLAAKLIGDGKLTTFQARALLRGRWKGLVLGNYVILEKLAQGGMGSVFKARHRRMSRMVCLKVMNSAVRKSAHSMQRFRQEARTVAALSHPNIVVAHDADEAEGVPFIVMEYIEGKDLNGYVNEKGPLKIKQALKVVTQAATAMEYAHAQGVVHRDIKPHNLLLSENENGNYHVKILDMGLARFDSLLADCPDASIHAAMTNTGVIMGTVDYMSPEQAICSRDADKRSDIYSLGCTMHFLLTGKRVYDGETMMARLVAHREQQIPSLKEHCDEASPGLDGVFHKMMAKNPAERYQSMADVLQDLNAISSGEDPTIAELPAVQETAVRSKLPGIQKAYRYYGSNRSTVLTGVGLLTLGLIAGVWAGSGLGTSDKNADPVTLTSPVNDSIQIAETTSPASSVDEKRALIVIPGAEKGSYFHGDQFEQITKALNDRHVSYEVASSASGKVRAKHEFTDITTGYKTDYVSTTIDLESCKSDEFDAVVLIGGQWNKTIHSHGGNRLRSLLKDSVNNGSYLAVVGDGESRSDQDAWWVVQKIQLINECEMSKDKHSQVVSGQPEGASGTIVRFPEMKSYHVVNSILFKE